MSGCFAWDQQGFVKTGSDLDAGDSAQFSQSRQPSVLETSIPAVFAIGDVRAGSVKRVASAVGEGARCVQLLHRVLAER